MNPDALHELLSQIRDGQVPVEEALERLARLPFRDLGHTVVDHHRALRKGFPEVVFGEYKTAEQITAIVSELASAGQNVLVTRVDPPKAEEVMGRVPSLSHEPLARCLVLRQHAPDARGAGPIAIVTAGTSDLPVAHEAALVVQLAGDEVVMVTDVGVAGVHRLFHRLDDLRRAAVVIVAAGMEGALPSVVGGLVAAPIIAVPTSVGYGAAFGGVAALLGMLTSCSSGVTVVNIDNGFGAGYAAVLMNRTGARK